LICDNVMDIYMDSVGMVVCMRVRLYTHSIFSHWPPFGTLVVCGGGGESSCVRTNNHAAPYNGQEGADVYSRATTHTHPPK
jgi:hypothetical protein